MKIKGILFCLLCINSTIVFSQDGRRIEKDKQLWTEIKIEKEVIKNLELELSHSLRWDENVSNLYRSFTQFTVSYDFTKLFSIKAGYRNAYGEEGYQRFIAIAGFDFEYKRWELDWNNRYEYTIEKIEANNSRIREKLSLEYDGKKWPVKPSIYGEIFLPIGNGQQITEAEKVRYGVALDVPLSKSNGISIETALQDTYKKKKINRDMLFSISYKFEF